jgi:S-formylglutathione hydrolase
MLAAPLARAITARSHLLHRRAAVATMASAAPEQLSQNKMFGGHSRRFKHQSEVLGCAMTFTVYFPPAAEANRPAPIIYYLSGLTCNDENFITKAGAQRKAAELGVALVAPDTSPRGLNVPGEAESWDFGVGAGAPSPSLGWLAGVVWVA